MAREKTVTRSFRIKESALSALQAEAEKRNISTNTILNLLLLSFAEYDRFLEEFNMIKLARSTFRRVLEASPEMEIKAAGKKAGGSLPRSFVLARDGAVTHESLIDYFRLMSQYANLFEFNMTRNGGTSTVTLIHDLGPKGSLFLGEYVRQALEGAGIDDELSVDEESVSIVLNHSVLPPKGLAKA